MSIPARLSTAARKASGDDENPRPKKLVGRQNSQGEIAHAIAYKQMQIQDLNKDVARLVAQFLTMNASESYHEDFGLIRMSKKKERSELDKLRLTSSSMNTQLQPMKFENSAYMEQLRRSNAVGMYLNALTWIRDLVMANRGKWMGHDQSGVISGNGILDRFVRDQTTTLNIPTQTPESDMLLEEAWMKLWGETEDESIEEVGKVIRSAPDIWRIIFRLHDASGVRTLLGLMHTVLDTHTWGENTLVNATCYLISIYGGVKVWTAVVWFLLTSNKVVNPIDGLWIAQYIDDITSVDYSPDSAQIKEINKRMEEGREWQKDSLVDKGIRKAFSRFSEFAPKLAARLIQQKSAAQGSSQVTPSAQ